MNLMKLLGDAYKEGMTVDEIQKALEGIELPQPNTEELEKANAEIKRYKDALTKSNSENAEYKRKEREKLSEDEKNALANKELIENLQNQIASYKREKDIADLTSRFIGLGFDKENATKVATSYLDGNADDVFAQFSARLESVTKDAKSTVLGGTPRPQGSTGATPTITKAQFDAMGLSERNELYVNNRELYEALKGE